MVRACVLPILVCGGLLSCAARPAVPAPSTRVEAAGRPAPPAPVEIAREDPAIEPEPRREISLPAGWGTVPVEEFEATLARWNPESRPSRLDPEGLDDLTAALEAEERLALRAVLLLAAACDPEADARLLARLERRLRPAEAVFPAVDVACAAALGRVEPPAPILAAALDELSRGGRPHPELPVRAECALVALWLGRVEVLPFLFAVLHEGTPARLPAPPWPREATSTSDLAFAQARVAQALSRLARIENPYRPEASAVERARAAAEIERALRPEEPRRP